MNPKDFESLFREEITSLNQATGKNLADLFKKVIPVFVLEGQHGTYTFQTPDIDKIRMQIAAATGDQQALEEFLKLIPKPDKFTYPDFLAFSVMIRNYYPTVRLSRGKAFPFRKVWWDEDAVHIEMVFSGTKMQVYRPPVSLKEIVGLMDSLKNPDDLARVLLLSPNSRIEIDDAVLTGDQLRQLMDSAEGEAKQGIMAVVTAASELMAHYFLPDVTIVQDDQEVTLPMAVLIRDAIGLIPLLM